MTCGYALYVRTAICPVTGRLSPRVRTFVVASRPLRSHDCPARAWRKPSSCRVVYSASEHGSVAVSRSCWAFSCSRFSLHTFRFPLYISLCALHLHVFCLRSEQPGTCRRPELRQRFIFFASSSVLSLLGFFLQPLFTVRFPLSASHFSLRTTSS